MSLAGCSLAGWSPPEPASASPAKKTRFTWIDLHAGKNAPFSSGAARPGLGQPGTVPGQQIGHQFAGHFQGGLLVVGAAGFGLVLHRFELLIAERSQLGGFDQHTLQMRIALFGDRSVFLLPSRFPKCSRQPAVALRLVDAGKARGDLQRPGQRRDRPDPWMLCKASIRCCKPACCSSMRITR